MYRKLAGPVDTPDHTVVLTDDTVSVDNGITPQICFVPVNDFGDCHWIDTDIDTDDDDSDKDDAVSQVNE